MSAKAGECTRVFTIRRFLLDTLKRKTQLILSQCRPQSYEDLAG